MFFFFQLRLLTSFSHEEITFEIEATVSEKVFINYSDCYVSEKTTSFQFKLLLEQSVIN